MRKVIIAIFLIVSIVLAIVLLLSHLSAKVDLQFLPEFKVLGLLYPYLLFANLAIILLALFFKPFLAILPLVAILGTLPKPLEIYAYNKDGVRVNGNSNEVKVLSYNVRLFNKYSWKDSLKTRDSIVNFLSRQDADVYLLQEFYHGQKGENTQNYQLVPKRLNATNTYFEYQETKDKNPKYFFGLSTLSKHPIIKSGVVVPRSDQENSKANATFSDVKIGNKTIRIYNVHLRSLGFNNRDYEFLKDVSKKPNNENLEGGKSILKKLIFATEKRTKEVDELLLHMSDSPYPMIIAGDFNETPFTFNTQQVSQLMKDAFLEAGNGFGLTYEGFGSIPSMRIDYIYGSHSLQFEKFQTHSVSFSDHRPISATFTVN
jgi:endonuclease/exonuclease/phosphatase family metal-dependent hydrolase